MRITYTRARLQSKITLVQTIKCAPPDFVHGSQLHSISNMGGRKKHRKHHDSAHVPPRLTAGGGDAPIRLFALQKDVLAVAFGTTLRTYDMRYAASA